MEWSPAGWRGLFEKWIIASSGTAWALYWLSRGVERREEWWRPSGLQLSGMKAGVIVTRHSPLCIVRGSPAPHNATTPQCSAVPRPPALNIYFDPPPITACMSWITFKQDPVGVWYSRARERPPLVPNVMKWWSPTLPPLYLIHDPTTSDLNDDFYFPPLAR